MVRPGAEVRNTGVHHAAQPDTEEASAFRRMQEKRLRQIKQLVALAHVSTLSPKAFAEQYDVQLARMQDASREVKAVRQINYDRGLKNQEPGVLRLALKFGRIDVYNPGV